MLQHLDTAIKPFIGKQLKSITRLSDAEVLVDFEDGTGLKVSVDGDCCSHSIFYEIEMPSELVGATLEDVSGSGWDEDSLSNSTADDEITAIEKVKAGGFDFSPEENSVWNVVLKTNKGNALIRHINASNGYYNGYVTFHDHN